MHNDILCVVSEDYRADVTTDKHPTISRLLSSNIQVGWLQQLRRLPIDSEPVAQNRIVTQSSCDDSEFTALI